MRVLVVEDNSNVSALLADGLALSNMIPSVVHDGGHADLMLSTAARRGEPYDAVVMDLTLPSLDGIEVLKRMRARNDTTPVLILSGRSSIDERVGGLEVGADDFLPKPFEFVELIARLRAMSRRHHRWHTSSPKVGNLAYDANGGSFSINGEPLPLPPRTRAILEALFRRPGSTVTKEFLTNLTEQGSTIEAVDIQMSRLRKKLADSDAMVSIKTIYGQGYSLVATSASSEAASDPSKAERRSH